MGGWFLEKEVSVAPQWWHTVMRILKPIPQPKLSDLHQEQGCP